MKKILVLAALFCLPFAVFADNPLRFVGEKSVTVDATGATFTVDYDGYLNLFAHGKCYFNLNPAGVTPNTSSKYLAAGGSLTSNTIYNAAQKIGLLSDSGTITVNFTVDAPERF